MKLSTAAACSLALALSACSPGANGKESGMP
jgi:gamma-glutamyl:cysteine ligase YbdK (ATP-grasp superfamily)